MDERRKLVFLLRQRGFELLRIERAAPLRLHRIDLGAAALRDVDHTRAEDAVYADQHGVAGLDEIGEQVSMPALPVPDMGRARRFFV